MTRTYEAALEAILAGSNDYDDLLAVYSGIEHPETEAQQRFKDFWEITGFIGSNGFEWLFEQQWSFDEFVSLFAEMEFSEALPILEKVRVIVPDDIRTPERQEEMHKRVRESFEVLDRLLGEYFDLNEHLNPKMAQFIRIHKADFRATIVDG